MARALRQPAIEARQWMEPITFVVLGLSLAAYYFSPQTWLAVPSALLFVTVAVFRLDLALLYVVFTAPFYLFPKNFGDMAFSLTEFTTLACFAALIIGTLRRPEALNGTSVRTLISLLKNPVTWFILAATLSLLVSEFPKYSLREYRTTVLEPFLFYLCLLSLPVNRKGIWRFLDAFVLLGLAMAIFSIYHYFFVGVVESTGGVSRVLAIYHSPNALALFLGRVAPMAVILTVLSGKLRDRVQLRPFYASASLIIGLALFLTYSRGAWVAVAVSLVSMLILWAFVNGRNSLTKALRRLAIGTLTALMAIGLVNQVLPVLSPGRLLSQATNLERLYLWQAAVAMIRDHPVLGIGLDNFLYQYPKYMLPEAWAEPSISHPHNLILDFWLRVGLIGLFSFLAMLYNFWRSGLRLGSRVTDVEITVIAIALMGTMSETIVHGMIDNSFFLIDLAVGFWLIYGLMQIVERKSV